MSLLAKQPFSDSHFAIWSKVVFKLNNVVSVVVRTEYSYVVSVHRPTVSARSIKLANEI